MMIILYIRLGQIQKRKFKDLPELKVVCTDFRHPKSINTTHLRQNNIYDDCSLRSEGLKGERPFSGLSDFR